MKEDMEEEMKGYVACATGDKLAFQSHFLIDTSLLAKRIGRSRDTVLHLVCRFKQKELASLILGLQPDLAKAKNDKEETPLHETSRVGELDIVKQLLDACPPLAYMFNRDRESALFIACSCGHLEVAYELCSKMDFLAWDEIGASCLMISASKGYTGNFVESCYTPRDFTPGCVDFYNFVRFGVFVTYQSKPMHSSTGKKE